MGVYVVAKATQGHLLGEWWQNRKNATVWIVVKAAVQTETGRHVEMSMPEIQVYGANGVVVNIEIGHDVLDAGKDTHAFGTLQVSQTEMRMKEKIRIGGHDRFVVLAQGIDDKIIVFIEGTPEITKIDENGFLIHGYD